jgi:hypothetical protein
VASWTISCSSSRPAIAVPTLCSASARCFSSSSRRPVSSASTRAACSPLSSSRLQRLDRVRRHLRQLGDDRLVVGRELAGLVPQLDQAEAGAVAGDQRRDQARSGRRAVGPTAGDPMARADHVARGVDDDRQHVVDGGGRGHRACGIGERAEGIAHGREDRIGRVDPRAQAGATPRIASYNEI